MTLSKPGLEITIKKFHNVSKHFRIFLFFLGMEIKNLNSKTFPKNIVFFYFQA